MTYHELKQLIRNWADNNNVFLTEGAIDDLTVAFAASEGTRGGTCYYCGEQVNNLSGNPDEWGVTMCHKEKPGKVFAHHIKCIKKRITDDTPDPGVNVED